MERYSEAFQENAIDAEVLPELTDADLERLGLLLGHRKKLLKAIAELRTVETMPAFLPRAPVEVPPETRRATEAERRQLTVLFCDLVGSTELSTALDPEDERELIRAYQSTVAGEVARFDGHIAKFMGDGVVAYFGYPRAHEDDAERAVRAALALSDAVPRVTTPGGEPLNARIGIATGVVVVGDLIGEGAAQEEAVAGETPALAARLQALATPGSIVIGKATRRLLGTLFKLEDLGPQHLKGFSQPVSAWRVLGEQRSGDRFQALRGDDLTPLVGRDDELTLLLQRWTLAKRGIGQLILLCGEPGIGKSRLVRALRDGVAHEPHTLLSHHCSPHRVNSALHPVIARLEGIPGLSRDDAPEVRLETLAALLAQATDRLDEAVALLANLLGIAVDGHSRAPNYSPQRKAQRTLEVLVEHVEGLAAGQPVLLVYEDVHWIDPSSLELLRLLIARIDRLRGLVLLTFRPEFMPSWCDHTRVTRLTLTRLTRPHVATMAGQVARKPLPGEIVQQIVARADGMPLFVEELTKTFVESGLLEDLGDRYWLAKPLPPLAVPATLHASLIARLDRLEPVKEVAQTAACIGRDFSFDLLSAVSPLSESDLGVALDRLVQAELVFRRSGAPETSYRFKHALVREAAYGSLLKSSRRYLHRVIATALERQFPAIVTAEPEIVAHHFTEGGLPARAVEYWLKAGRSAMGRSAVVEVVNHTRTALNLVESLSDDAARVQMEIELQALRGTALQALQGWGAKETGEAFSRARELCEAVQASERILPILYGIYVFHLSRAEYASALMLAEQFLRSARTLQRAPLVGIGHRLLASPTCLMGDAASARDELESGLALYATDRPPSLVAELGMDQKSGSLGWLSIALLALGFPDQALDASETGLAHADALDHLPSLVFALSFAGMVRIERGEYQEARRHAEHLERLSSEQGLTLHLSTARIIRGATLVASADRHAGLEDLRVGTEGWWSIGQMMLRPYFLSLIARAHVAMGDLGSAHAVLEEAARVIKETNERYFEAEVHRQLGEVQRVWGASAGGSSDAQFALATDIAQARSHKMWELRAVMSRARLGAQSGKPKEAYCVLTSVYGWFTEGFDTADLKEAKALLDALG